MSIKQLFLLLGSFPAILAYGQTTSVSLTPAADSYTNLSFSSTNYGASDTLALKTTATSYCRAFLRFDLSGIPSTAVISSARLVLTPKGTEGVGAPTSTELYLDIVNSTWTEAGITHTTSVVNNPAFPPVTASKQVSLKREFDLAAHVQAMVEGRVTNFGWRIRRNPETTVTNTRYYSKDAATPGNRPKLEIIYFTPASVSAATIVHATTLAATNGSVTPTIINGGDGTKSYRWYNSAGTLVGSSATLTGVGYGWYGLKVYSTTPGDTLYNAFIIGAQCEDVNITFDPGPNYINDAMIYDLVTSGVIDNRQVNTGSYPLTLAESWTASSVYYDLKSLLKFNIWIDPALTIAAADMTLFGDAHNPFSRANTSELIKITQPWRENGVAFNIAPATSSSITVAMPAMPAGDSNAIRSIKAFADDWKASNTTNYGMLFQLTSYADSRTRQRYHSSDGLRVKSPVVVFRMSLQNSLCNYSSHTIFKRELDGSFVKAVNGTVKFYFKEEYAVESGKKIPLTLYDDNQQIVAAIDINGAAVSGRPLLPAIAYKGDDNRDALNLSTYGLTAGKFYVLQLTNSTGEKRYIRFQYN